MDKRILAIVNGIRDKKLRGMVAELVENPTIEIGGKVYSGLPLATSPAGLSHHHGYEGGFIEHVVASAEIATTLCDVIERVYKGWVNRDFVLAGVALHDLFKPLVYREIDTATAFTSRLYESSVLGEYFDHLTLIVAELIRRGFPLEVVHIVCAHHGYQAGPIGPRSVEALVVHLADVADSQLNSEVLRAARFMIRTTIGEEWVDLTSKEAFEIVKTKTTENWKGTAKTVEKIKKKRNGTKRKY